MILIPCKAKCDQCGTEAAASVEVEGAGRISGGGMFGIGTLLGTIMTAAGWKLVGSFLPTEIVCSDACETAWNEKKLKEEQDRKAKQTKKEI